MQNSQFSVKKLIHKKPNKICQQVCFVQFSLFLVSHFVPFI